MENNIVKFTIPKFDREYFMKNTGVFVTPLYFDMIQFEFDESGLSPKSFCKNWLEENDPMIETTQFTGNFKYILDDDSMTNIGGNIELEELTAFDLIENLSEEAKHYYDKYQELSHDMSLLREEYQNVIKNAKDLITKIQLMNTPAASICS